MRQPYSTDLSDAEWSCLEPHLPAPKATRCRRVYPLRQILNAIFYLGEERLFVALASPRLPSLAQRLPLLQAVALGWELGEDARCAA